MWKQWVNAILGLLVLAVPFLGLTTAAFTWTLAIAGIIIAALAIWSVAEASAWMDERELERGRSAI